MNNAWFKEKGLNPSSVARSMRTETKFGNSPLQLDFSSTLDRAFNEN